MTSTSGGEGGGRGAESYDREKASLSKNHSILSGAKRLQCKVHVGPPMQGGEELKKLYLV
jgi:hypothetical protein